jgi:hypothetical protein
MVKAFLARAHPLLTVKAQTVLPRVNRLPQRFGFEEV